MTSIKETKIRATTDENGKLAHFNFSIELEGLDTEAGEAVKALFPKYTRLDNSTISYMTGEKNSYVSTQIYLWENGVNGGVNETGVKRIKAIIKSLKKHNMPTVFDNRWINAVESLEALENLI